MASHVDGDDVWADRFLSAALEPHLWDDALRAMATATGSQHGQLIGFGPGAAPFNWISDIDASALERAAAADLHSPDSNFRIAADIVPGRPDVVHEAHYDAARQGLTRGGGYLDLCADLDIFDGCHSRLAAGGGLMIGLALLRGRKDGRTGQEQRDLFAHVAGHARTAVRLQRAIEHRGLALLTGAFEAMGRACWLLDASGRVGGMTPQAQDVLSSGRIRLADGWLEGERSDETRAILRAIRAVVVSPAQPCAPVVLETADGGPGMVMEFYPLPTQPWALPFAPRALVIAREGPAAARQANRLMRVFALTLAEADIAVRLASGLSRRQIAAARGVSAETLKAQLRSIYEKTGCSRESQLVRMIGLIEG